MKDILSASSDMNVTWKTDKRMDVRCMSEFKEGRFGCVLDKGDSPIGMCFGCPDFHPSRRKIYVCLFSFVDGNELNHSLHVRLRRLILARLCVAGLLDNLMVRIILIFMLRNGSFQHVREFFVTF